MPRSDLPRLPRSTIPRSRPSWSGIERGIRGCRFEFPWSTRRWKVSIFGIKIRHAHGTAPYAFWVRFFTNGSHDALWYTRAAAWVGELRGRKVAVIDDDTNGSYDDPTDVVVFDLDGDGHLDGGHRGSERLRRYRVIPWGGELPAAEKVLSIVEVDPVAGRMTLDLAKTAILKAEVLDVRKGTGIPRAEVSAYPGPFSALTDGKGRVEMRLPAGQLDFLSVVADGYWGRVIGPGQDGDVEIQGKGKKAAYRVLLEPGPCAHEAIRWCGQQTLLANSVASSSLDLDHGVVGPRVGPPPGPMDVGWYVPPEGLMLSTFGEAGLSVVGQTDFENLSLEQLRELPFGLSRIAASPSCGGKGKRRDEAVLRRGTVLGVRTQEGRLGKIEITDCARKLGLRWVIYDELLEKGGEASSPGPVPL